MTLTKKLGIEEDSRVGCLNRPDHLLALIPGLALTDGPCDVLVGFAQHEHELEHVLAARERLSTAGGLWIAWPKKTSALASSIDREIVRAAGLATGWVDNKVCAIDADWSGLRFVRRKHDR